MLSYDFIKTSIGYVTIYSNDNDLGLISSVKISEKAPDNSKIVKNNESVKFLKNELELFFSLRKPIDIALEMLDFSPLNIFSRKVLSVLKAVPLGKVISYGKLAELSGYPNASRAVGTVMKNNPFPLIIPCHRVIKSDFSIGNFNSGVENKLKLLRHELGNASILNNKINSSDFML